VRIELVLKGILPVNHSFQCVERLIFFQIGVFKLDEEKHVAREGNQFVFEAVASSTWFPCQKRVSF
jgi:hypothetical protein